MTLDLKDISKLEKIAHDVHQNAVDKGWWPLTTDGKADWGARNVGEILILATSELAEALEVWRDGKNVMESWSGEKGKPEGFPIEMADFVIRVIETMVACKAPFAAAFKLTIAHGAAQEGLNEVLKITKKDKPNIGNELMEISSSIAAAYHYSILPGVTANHIVVGKDNRVEGMPLSLAHAVLDAFKQADRLGFDMWKAIEEKHAYNKTRPIRHGGKLA
jgi:hypothetical protein